MSRTDYNDLALLVRVAEAPTLTAAARALDVPKSTLSRRLADLEARLGVALLRRGARKIHLSEAGAALVAQCGPLFARIEEAEAALARDGEAARGSLRISAPADFGVHVCAPIVQAFLREHAGIGVDVLYDDRVVDIAAERFDVALRIGAVKDTSLVVRTIGSVGAAVVASPDYVARRGAPAQPGDLATHDCLVFTSSPFTASWSLTHADGRVATVEVPHRLAANSLAVVREAARAGLGVARLPDYLYIDDCAAGRLVRLLPGWSTGARKVVVVYPQTRRLAPAVRLFIEFAAAKLRA